jgi:hypothetical protein
MTSAITIDFYGTLDKDSKFWLEMLEYLKIEGFRVYVIGGTWPINLKADIEHNGYILKKHFDGLLPVFTHLMKNGADVWYSEDQDCWKADPAAWWASKAAICKEIGSSIHFDNDIRFKPAFSHISTRFVYLRWEEAQAHLKEWSRELFLNNAWEDDYMYMSGFYPG